MKKASRIMYLVNMIICFLIMGMFACLFVAAFAGVSAFLSLKARNNGNKTLYILNIIFGALGGGEIAIAASILALIADSKEKKGEKEVKEIEEK